MRALQLLGEVTDRIKTEKLEFGEIAEPVMEDLISCLEKIAWAQPVTAMHPTAMLIASSLYDWLFLQYSHLETMEPTMDEIRAVVMRAWRVSNSWAEI